VARTDTASPPEFRKRDSEGRPIHRYFLLRLRAAKSALNVAGPDAEFNSVRWIRPREFNLAWLPPMKRRAYRRVLRDFFGAVKE
jgi:hypothetical protein